MCLFEVLALSLIHLFFMITNRPLSPTCRLFPPPKRYQPSHASIRFQMRSLLLMTLFPMSKNSGSFTGGTSRAVLDSREWQKASSAYRNIKSQHCRAMISIESSRACEISVPFSLSFGPHPNIAWTV